MVVTDKLIEHFPDVVDVNFTAHMEDELDDIAEGGVEWTQVLHEFNEPFQRALEKAEHSFERYGRGARQALPAMSKGGTRAGQAAGEARPVRQVHRLPELSGVPLHP